MRRKLAKARRVGVISSSGIAEGGRGPAAKLTALHVYIARLASATTAEDVYEYTLDAMNNALGFTHADFSTVEGGQLHTKVERGTKGNYPLLKLDGPGIIVKAANQRKPVYVPDTRKDAAYLPARQGMLSEFAVPVLLDHQTIGVLNVESSRLNAFDKLDRQVLGTLANYVSSSLSRIKGEQSLHKFEVRLRGILSALPSMVFEIDSKGVFRNYYSRIRSDLAFPPEEFLGKSVRAVFPLPVAAKITSAMKTAKQTNAVQVVEVQLRTKGGVVSEREGRISSTSTGGFIVVVNDITQRKKAEVELRKSEERYRTLFDHMLDGTYRSTHDGRLVEVNPAFVKMFGYLSKEEMLEIPDVSKVLYFAPDDRASAFLDTGQERVEVFRMRRKDGTEIWVEDHGSYVHDERGNVVFHEGVLRDVTERMRAEEAIRESEKRYRDLVEVSPDAVAVHDGKRVLFANPTAARILGIGDPAKAVGLEMTRFVHASSRPVVAARVDEMMNQKRPVPVIEERFVRLDGKIIDVEVAAMAVTWQGQPAVLVAFRDVTEKKVMADELKSYSEHLEDLVKERTEKLKEAERLAAMGQMSAMVAHDLRNPLTGIAGAVYNLRKQFGPSASERTKEMLDIIEKDVEYSSDMMNGLLEYSGEIRLNIVETDPRTVIEKSLTLVRIPATVRVFNLVKSQPKIALDFEKMTRVSINIIQNAVEAMPKGGELSMKSEEVEGNLRLSFTDTGHGVTDEVMSRIWVPFSTTKAKGLGLGLPMAKNIVEAHGGTITIESALKKGTTVTVTLPVIRRPKEGEAP